MAVLKIVTYGDEKLRQKTKEVHKVSSKVQKIIKDMLDTMYAYNGVGLAAPQIGSDIRAFVIDVADPKDPPDPMVFINPKIIKKSGAINSNEGCISFPEAYTNVRRYKSVTVKAMDQKGRSFIIEAPEGDLLTRALQHELDHLDSILFVDHARNRFETDNELKAKGLPPINPDYLVEEQELETAIQHNELKETEKVKD